MTAKQKAVLKYLSIGLGCWGLMFAIDAIAPVGEVDPAQEQQKADAAWLKAVENCFSGYDGAHYELKKVVKAKMHDPDSFKCNAATWQATESGSTIMVTMGYSGTNGYGARVNAVVTAECLVSGEVVQVF